jgi:UDP-glucose 4-epimerase
MQPPVSAHLIPPPRGNDVVFVTGAAGFIGRHVVSGFKRSGWRVAGFGRSEPPQDGLDLAQADLWCGGQQHAKALIQAGRQLGPPAALVQAVGSPSVGASFTDPAADFVSTVGTLKASLDFIRAQAPGARLVLLSSAAVYGRASQGLIDEYTPIDPISPYGLHKLMAEGLAQGWAELFGLDVAVLRLFSIYGPGLRKQLLWDVARRLSEDPSRLELSGTGEELRDFLYVDDAVRLIGVAATYPKNGRPLLLNGGAGEGTSVRTAVERLAAALRVRPMLAFNGEVRPGDPASLVADISAARRMGFEPLVGLGAGLTRYGAWVRQDLAEATG